MTVKPGIISSNLTCLLALPRTTTTRRKKRHPPTQEHYQNKTILLLQTDQRAATAIRTSAPL